MTVTAETVGCPKMEGGSVWLKPPEAASTTAGALEFVVTTVVLTMTLPATMLLMNTYAHRPFQLHQKHIIRKGIILDAVAVNDRSSLVLRIACGRSCMSGYLDLKRFRYAWRTEMNSLHKKVETGTSCDSSRGQQSSCRVIAKHVFSS